MNRRRRGLTGNLLVGHQVETTTLGIAVAAASVVVMPMLGVAKQRLGSLLESGATAGEGTQNLMCAAQAVAVLIGLAVHAATGIDWIDPVVALVLAAWAVQEGQQSWQGEECC